MLQAMFFMPRAFEIMAEMSKTTSENSLPSLSDRDVSCRSRALKIAAEYSAAILSGFPFQLSVDRSANLVFFLYLLLSKTPFEQYSPSSDGAWLAHLALSQ
jgi:hypothetical protein